MRFKKFISEMTMKVPSYEALENYMPQFNHLINDGFHCGDIEHFNIYRKQRDSFTDYAAFLEGKIVAFFVLDGNEITNAFVSKDYRKKGLFSAFLFFLKRNEGLSKIILGDNHSYETIEAVKRIHKRFETSWFKGDEKVPYNPQQDSPYYSMSKPTGWKIMLENDGDFSKWQKYFHHELQPSTRLLEMFYFEPFVDSLDE
jgi:hypothetical protein